MRNIFHLLGVILLMSIIPEALAEVKLDIAGQVRARTEFDEKSFSESSATYRHVLLRTRIGVSAEIDTNTHAFVQLQDSRLLGGFNEEGDYVSGTLENGKNVDVHEAYLHANHLWKSGPGIKAGRFEVNLGNQRVFGSVGWNNVGRSWEGFQTDYSHNSILFNAFWLIKNDRAGMYEERDFDIYGIYTRLNSIGLDIFLFYEYDDLNFYLTNSTFQRLSDNMLDRISAGLYFKNKRGRFDYESNVVYQFGSSTDISNQEYDISAYLITFESGYVIPGAARARIAIGIDYTSGDDNTTDDKIKYYDNLYYTGHKFHGYMDKFTGLQYYGLADIMLRGKFAPKAGWLIKSDLHYFTRTADYEDFKGNTTKDVGTEFDVVISTTSVAGTKIEAGGALFFASESYAGLTDPEPAYWMYGMLTADF